jgi:hypothetical protein
MFVKKLPFLLALLFLCFACGHSEHIPSNVLDQQKMQGVLVDMLQADSYVSSHPLVRDSSAKVSQRLYSQIFQKHKISRTDFERSLDFYNSHPKLMEENIQTVIDSLSAIEAHSH